MTTAKRLFFIKKFLLTLYELNALHNFVDNLAQHVSKVKEQALAIGCLKEYNDFCEHPSDLNKLCTFLLKYTAGYTIAIMGRIQEWDSIEISRLADKMLTWSRTCEGYSYWANLNSKIIQKMKKYIDTYKNI